MNSKTILFILNVLYKHIYRKIYCIIICSDEKYCVYENNISFINQQQMIENVPTHATFKCAPYQANNHWWQSGFKVHCPINSHYWTIIHVISRIDYHFCVYIIWFLPLPFKIIRWKTKWQIAGTCLLQFLLAVVFVDLFTNNW